MDKSEIIPYQLTILGKNPQGKYKIVSKHKTESYSIWWWYTYNFQFSNSPKPDKLYIFRSEEVLLNYKPEEEGTNDYRTNISSKKRHTYKSNIINWLHIRWVGIADDNLEDYQYFIKNQIINY